MTTRRRKLFLTATLLGSVFVAAPRVDAGKLTASATRYEYGRTRSVTHTSTTQWKAGCLICIDADMLWKDGKASLKTLTVTPGTKPPTKTPTKSRVTPIASTSGTKLSMSLSLSGAGVGSGTTSTTCSAGAYSANGASVSVTMAGTWCKAHSSLGMFSSTKVKVNAETLYTNAWSRFSASS